MKKLGILAFLFATCLCCGKETFAEQTFYFKDGPSNNKIIVNETGEMTGSKLVDDEGYVYDVRPNLKWQNRYAQIDMGRWDNEEIAENNIFEMDGFNGLPKRVNFMINGAMSKSTTRNNHIRIKNVDELYNTDLNIGYGEERFEDNSVEIENVRVLGASSVSTGFSNGVIQNNLVKIKGAKEGFKWHTLGYYGEGNATPEINLVLIDNDETDETNVSKAIHNKIILENVKEITEDINKIVVVQLWENAKTIENSLSIRGISGGADIAATKGFTVVSGGWEANGIAIAIKNSLSMHNTNLSGLAMVANTKEAHGNTMNLSGHSNFSNAYLVGAIDETSISDVTDEYEFGLFKLNDSNKQNFSGNALHLGKFDDKIETWYGSKVKGLEGFQEIHFHKLDWNPDKPSLAIIEKSDLSNTSFNTTDISFKSKEGLKEALKAGAKMTLIDTGKEDMGIKENNIVTDGTFKVGTAFEGKGDTLVEGNNLVYKIVTEGTGEFPAPEKDEVVDVEPILPVREQTHNVMIGNVSGIAAIVAGQKYIESGVSNNLDQNKFGLTTSIVTSGASTKYETGSNVKTDVWNASFGVGNTVKTKNGALAYMAFYEYGKGNYKVNSDIGTGEGDVSYTGIAFAGKYQLNNNFYTAGSFRIGEMKNDAKDVLADQDKNTYSYNTEGMYTGLSATLGKKVIFSPDTSLDIYGRFAHTSIEKDEFTINDEKYSLDAVSSNVLSLGSKMQHNLSNWQVYYGLAIEQELSGKAKGTVDGAEIRSADISGTSFVGEIGAKLKVSNDSPWSLDLGVQGSAGKHKEVRGNFGVTYSF